MMRPFAWPIAVALMLAGCTPPSDGATEVLVIGEATPALGDPLRPPGSEADALLRLATAQGLVRFDAAGQIEPGLAERWNVSDDGLSYIFRLGTAEWPDGRKVTARGVARLLTRQLRANRDHPTREALGAVAEVVAMTDRVIEIRLNAPRPNLLSLLAQPEFALIDGGGGSGPFRPVAENPDKPGLLLRRELAGSDGEDGRSEEVRLDARAATSAIAAFRDGQAALVLGGTIDDLPLARAAGLPRNALRFDPVAGLFGLAPARRDGPIADPEVRRLLNQAIDRAALLAALDVPGLAPRATLLQGGLAGLGDPPQPAWLAVPPTERRAALVAAARDLRDEEAVEPVRLRLRLPEGRGGALLLARLTTDWAPLGFQVERAQKGQPADLKWVDLVAPSDSPAWFLRQFRCAAAPVCAPDADPLLQSAREAPIAVQRAGLFAEAARLMDEAALFLAIAAPVRWSLVARGQQGFAENRYGRHPLTGLSGEEGRR